MYGSVNVPGGSTQGADGKSAYQIAVENGFSGTEAQWLASLKGDKGETGADGRKGDTGDTGQTGPAGPGLPAGGTAKQVPVKEDDDDYNVRWKSLLVDDVKGAAPTSRPVFYRSISMGRKDSTEEGTNSLAHGTDVEASGSYSHAEGGYTQASGDYSHAEGRTSTAIGAESHAEGVSTKATGNASHAEGNGTEATGHYSHAEGRTTKATGNTSHAGGEGTIAAAECQTAIGKCNVESNIMTDRFIVGKGNIINRANCFRVTDTGVYATGAHNTTGADYAEMFEWTDGNSNKQDRCGRFVTLDGAKIRLASSEDDFILGIVSGDPSVVGDVHDDQWQGMYLYDIFGRPLWEDVDVSAVTEEVELPIELSTGYGDTKTALKETRIIIPAHTERRQKPNPNYDPDQTYIPRSKRPEWTAVGMMGKLVLIDDGTCEINGWAKPSDGGIGTKSDTPTKFRVMARLDETHVRVLIL